MRRWSVGLTAVIIACILLLEGFGLEPDGYRSRRAAALVKANPGACILTGRITEAVYAGEEKCRVTMDCGGSGKVLVTVRGEGCPYYDLPGRYARVRVELSLPRGASNPGTFDYRKHLRSEGIYLLGSCRVTDLQAGRCPANPFFGLFPNRVSRFRHHFYTRLKDLESGEGESAAVLTGMLFGSREYLEEDTYEGFQKNGTAHILSVSGLHTGIIYGGIRLLLGKRRRSRTGTGVIVGALVLYAFLASFSISVIRAVWMIFLGLAAEKLHRRYDMLAAACITASFLLILNPALIHSAGFLLSFSAVVSLAVAGSGLERFPEPGSGAGKTFRKVFLPVAAIQFGMAPVNACLFHYFSLAAFLANLPVIFLSALIIPAGMAAGLLSLMPEPFDPLFFLFTRVSSFLSEEMCFFNDLTGLGGRLSWQIPAPSLWMVMGYYLVLWLLLSEHTVLFRPDRETLRRAGILLAALFVLAGIQTWSRPDAVFVDVGQGDCIHLHTRNGKDYLVDGGGSVFSDYDVGKEAVVPYLLANGVGRLDGVFISHMDADHYKGLAGVMEEIPVERVYLYEGYENCLPETLEKLGIAEGFGPQVVLLSGGDKIRLGRRAEAEILFPEEIVPMAYEEEEGFGDAGGGTPAGEGETDLNSASLVMMAELRGVKILLTGDIGEEQENALVKNGPAEELRCDILKVPHHGSKYSSGEGFLEKAGPRAAVIQVGENNRFGHPAWQTLDRLQSRGAAAFRNDRDGAILLRIGRKGFTLKGFRSGRSRELEAISSKQ